MAGKAEKKNKSMGKLTIQVIIPVIILFLGILVVMFQSMFEARQLVYRLSLIHILQPISP